MQTQGISGRRAGVASTQPRAARMAAPAVARRPRVSARAADAKITGADLDQMQQAAGTAPSSEASKCPFLAALPTPPPARAPWYRRLDQLFKPAEYSRIALGPHEIVDQPPAMGMPAQYVLGRADFVRTVFSGEADGSVTTAPPALFGARQLLGASNLVVVPEPRHTYLRKLIMPAFTNEAIERLVPRMEAVLTKYIDAWAGAGSPVKAHDQLRKMTFEFIIAVVLGRDYPAADLDRLSGLFTTWTRGLLAWPFIDLPFLPFGKAVAARKELVNFFQAEVDRARAHMAAGREVPGILGSLVAAVDEDGNRLTDVELSDNLILLMLAGHDTSSTTLTNVMACLQNNRHVLAKLREEQAALVQKRGGRIDGTALKEMPYADAVIRETLRLNNVVSGLMRKAAKDFQLGDYRVPEGTPLLLPLTHLALNDPRFADDEPAAFKPERMLTPEGLKPGALMPFGHGPRFCAGYSVAMAEMKVFLALLARHYDFEADTKTEWVQEIGRVPKNGLPMTVTRLAA